MTPGFARYSPQGLGAQVSLGGDQGATHGAIADIPPHTDAAASAFIVVDPNLKDVTGHYFEYDAAVMHAASAAGLRPIVLGNVAIAPNVAEATDAVPAFQEDIWGPADRRGPFGQLVGNLRFLGDLLRALHGRKLPRDSVLFAHTFVQRQILGLALLALLRPHLQMVFLLRYQPDFYRNLLSKLAFRLMERFGRGQIRLTTDSERLARALEDLTTLPVEVLPIPHSPPPARAAPAGAQTACHFVSLGNARDEKGIFEILDAIRLLHERGELAGCRFTLQCNDAAPDVAAAIAAFRKAAIPGCHLIDSSLDSDAYYDLLWQADVVLLPYWRSIYHGRTSGVFMEALSAGKPVIATRNTWMSDQLREHGAGLICVDRDPVALARAIREAADILPQLAAQAAAGRAGWVATHNAAALVDAVMTAPLRPAMRPPQRIAILYPWGDLTLGRSGAARRANLLIDYLAPTCASMRALQAGAYPAEQRDNVRIESLGNETGWSRLASRAVRVLINLLGPGGRRHAWLFWQYLALRANPWQRRRLQRLIEWADVVLLEYPFWAPVVTPMARRAGRQVVLSTYDVLAQQVRENALLQRLAWRWEERALRAADTVVAVSPGDAALLAGRGIQATLSPNPTDMRLFGIAALPDPWRIVREFYGVPLSEGPILLFVGSRHEPNLIAVERLRALAVTLAARPETANVVIVVAGTCAEPSNDGAFIGLGPVEDVLLLALYRVATAVVIPLPFGTGASLKTVEAMAASVPVLGTSVAFRGLSVDNGVDALVEDDLNRYPDHIAALLADPAGRERLGAAARRFAAAYDFAACFAPYRNLLGLANAPRPHMADPIERLTGLARLALEAGRTQLAQHLLSPLPGSDPRVEALLIRCHHQDEADLVLPPAAPALRSPTATGGRAALWERFHARCFDEVAAMASAQLEMSPGDGELHFLLAQSLHNDMLDLPHAMSEYNAAFAAGYDPYWVLVGRARLHRDLGSYRDAIRDYLHAALRRPLNRVTPRLLFHALRLSIRWRHSSADEPSPDRQATEAAWRLFHTGAFKESAAAAESLLETTPGNGELCLLLAQSLHNGMLDLPRALAAYDAALAGGCERYWALAGRARLHRHFGHRRQAIADVAAALANRPFGPVTTAIVITGSRVLGRRVRSLFGAPIGRAAE